MVFFFLTLKVKNILLWFAKHEEFKSFLIFLLALCSFLTKLYVPVPNSKSQNIPKVVIVRRGAGGFWEFGEGGSVG